MEELVIPPSPNWYHNQIFVCAPDNTVLFGSRRDVVIINPKEGSDEALDIDIIYNAHSDRLVALAINTDWWQPTSKHFVTASADFNIKLWNLETRSVLKFNKDHAKFSDPIIGVGFSKNKIISATENGHILIWVPKNNNTSHLQHMFAPRTKLSCMMMCPYDQHKIAFGTHDGLVYVVQINQEVRVLHKLRCHDKSITGLSWCPVRTNIFKKGPGAAVLDALYSLKNKRRVGWEKKNMEKVDDKKEPVSLIENQKVEIHKIEENSSNYSSSNDAFTNMSIQFHEALAENGSDEGNSSNVNLELTESDEIIEEEKTSQNIVELINTQELVEEIMTPKIVELTDEMEVILGADVIEEKKIIQNLESPVKRIGHEYASDDFLAELVVPEPEPRPKLVVDKTNPWGNVVFNDSDEEENLQDVPGETIQDNSEKSEGKQDDAQKKDFLVECQDLKRVIDETKDIEVLVTPKSVRERPLEPEDGFLLATACREGRICIWRTGRLLMHLPLPLTYQKQRSDNRGTNTQWVALCWATPGILFSSTPEGKILAWNLLPEKMSQSARHIHDIVKYRHIHSNHKRTVFCLGSPSVTGDLKVWSMSQDRWIVCANIDRKVICACCTLAGFVYDIASSPIEPTRVALAVGDQTLRIWDIGRPHVQVQTASLIWERVKGKVLTLAWHPELEYVLAFGTSEGRVGEVDPNGNRSPVIYFQHHNVAVFKVQWGPGAIKGQTCALYSCADGEVVAHDPLNPQAPPTVIFSRDNRISYFSWRSNGKMLAAGSKDGQITIIDAQQNLLRRYYSNTKIINCLSWHPESTVMDKGFCPLAGFLAVSSGEKDVFLFDTKLEDAKPVGKIQEHQANVRALAWSPHVPGRLATASDDGTARVYNALENELISVFKKHSGDSVLSVMWSPVDADILITGGRDLTCRVWRVSKNPPPKDGRVVTNPKRKGTSILPRDPPLVKTESENKGGEGDTEVVKKTRIFDIMSRLHGTQKDNAKAIVEKMIHEIQDTTSDYDPAMLFGSRDQVDILLDLEYKKHMEFDRFDNAANIALWKGNLGDVIREAIIQGKLTPFMISLAPMVSHQLWKEAIIAYAETFIQKEDGIKTAAYFLAVHDVNKAIDVLCKKHLYKEAISVARLRLSEDDSMHNHLLELYAEQSRWSGSFEESAQCYIRLGQIADAARILNKRNDTGTLLLALELARKTDDKDLINSIEGRLAEAEVKEKLNAIKDQQLPELPSRAEAFLKKELECNDESVTTTPSDKHSDSQPVIEVDDDKALVKTENL